MPGQVPGIFSARMQLLNTSKKISTVILRSLFSGDEGSMQIPASRSTPNHSHISDQRKVSCITKKRHSRSRAND